MNKRLILVMGFFFVFWLAWTQLGIYLGIIKQVPPEPEQEITQIESPLEDSSDAAIAGIEQQTSETSDDAETAPPEPEIEPELVVLENDQLRLELDNRGGIITRAELKQYFNNVDHDDTIELISARRFHPGLVLLNGDVPITNLFQVEKPAPNQVRFSANINGKPMVKTFTLGDSFELAGRIEYDGAFHMVVAEGLQPILPGDKLKPSFFDFGAISPKILHMAWSQDGEHKNKTPSGKTGDSFAPLLKEPKPVIWAGVKDTYFANVFTPSEALDNFLVRKVNLVQQRGEKPSFIPAVALPTANSIEGEFYLGPIKEEKLAEAGPELENLLSYGWAGLLSEGLFYALDFFHDKTGNWGWSIIILTFLIRMILIPLMLPSLKSGYKMRELQPEIEKLKKKFSGDDLETKQKLSQATFGLYKKHGVNPFSSCFTMLAQMPVFFAYFSLLRSSFHLRQAEWMFWIQDMSIRDHTYVLPVIMGVTMYFSTAAMPTPMSADPMQARMMKFMPVVFSLFFIGMPAGLVLYMVTSNVFTLAQTYVLKWRYYKT